MTAFSDFFTVVGHAEETHLWTHAAASPQQLDEAASWIAESIARSRCGNSPQYFEAWNSRRHGGPPHSDEIRDVLVAYVASDSIGTPEEPANATHLEGLVAEFIWYELALAGPAAQVGDVRRIEEPSWSSLDRGGDGLVIYENAGALAFCLWESKAHDAESSVRDVVNGACRQLSKKAIRYLARMSKVGQAFLDPELRAFYGQLAEFWRNQGAEAAGGVSVTTTSEDVTDSFDNIGSYWSFAAADQRQGIVIVIEDFSSFAARVQEHLWTGL